MNKTVQLKEQVTVIGAGFAGLAAAAYLAQAGYRVRLLEKNEMVGGRARRFEAEGYTFDMGPSWYWMPEVFEQFFADFGHQVSDFYDLRRLDPSYEIFFADDDRMEVPAGVDALRAMFEKLEPGSGSKLDKFLAEAAYKYEVGMGEFVEKPSHSILEFADLRVLKSMFRLQMFSNIKKYVRSQFKNPQLRELLEFPVLFLGATPANTPALYSLMNHADLSLGTWYPMGGMHRIIEGMLEVARSVGVEVITAAEVSKVDTSGSAIQQIHTQDGRSFQTDLLICGADYHHFEQEVLAPKDRMYSKRYWEKRTMAPSSLLFYVGLDRRVPDLHHHTLFFDADFEQHAHEIYTDAKWPSDPLFYVCAPSVTDPSVAPEGGENLFFLMPLAPDLEDSEEQRERYWTTMCERFAVRAGFDIRPHVVYRRSYAHQDFKADYHAYRGNAYGLANTLFQTAFLKPKLRSRKLSNLWYTGQLTTPGPGMPPSLISGRVVAQDVLKALGGGALSNTFTSFSKKTSTTPHA